MKKICLLLMMAFFVTMAHATGVISPEAAQTAAKNFMLERTGNPSLSLSDFTLEKTVSDESGNALYYVFNMNDHGFILISASELTTPVIAFSTESKYKGNESSAFMEAKYKSQIKTINENPELADSKAYKAWKAYTRSNEKGAKVTITGDYVEPLVTTVWEQGKYYNQYCPYHPQASSYYDYRVPNGCVALTMSNILNFYRYPRLGFGGTSYIPFDYDFEADTMIYEFGRITERFDQIPLEYEYITDDVSAYQGNLGKLTYLTGVSTRMGYGADGSGSNGEYCLNGLKTNWLYNQSGALRSIDDVADYKEWEDIVVTELNKNRPVYYAGYSEIYGQGHAWIVDGYVTVDTTRYFHVNWGWSGSDNGFYRIDMLHTRSFGSFSQNEYVIVGIAPEDTLIAKPQTSFDTLVGKQGSICDGAGNIKYKPNSNRKWLVQAPNATSYTFNFRKIKTRENDEIIIYNGATEESGVKVRYSGDYLSKASRDNGTDSSILADFIGTALPGDVTVTAPAVLVVFTSNADTNVNYGFNINYKAAISSDPNSCSENSSPSYANYAVISNKADASQEGAYHAHTNCTWRINCPYIDGYALNFSNFDLRKGDFVDIFDNTSSSRPVLLHRFDMDNLPDGVYNITPALGNDQSRRMLIKFSSDNVYEGEGFELVYYAIKTDIPGNDAFENISVYPNPATNYINVDYTTVGAETLVFQLMDITGRIVRTETVSHTGGTSSHHINTSDLSNGIYMLRAQSSQGSTTKKVIIN